MAGIVIMIPIINVLKKRKKKFILDRSGGTSMPANFLTLFLLSLFSAMQPSLSEYLV
jgi:hypothetical protein